MVTLAATLGAVNKVELLFLRGTGVLLCCLNKSLMQWAPRETQIHLCLFFLWAATSPELDPSRSGKRAVWNKDRAVRSIRQNHLSWGELWTRICSPWRCALITGLAAGSLLPPAIICEHGTGYLTKIVLWFNPSWQASPAEPLTRSPVVGWERESEG